MVCITMQSQYSFNKPRYPIEQQAHHLEWTQYEHVVDLDCNVTSGWVRLEQDTGPPVLHDFEGVCKIYQDVNM